MQKQCSNDRKSLTIRLGVQDTGHDKHPHPSTKHQPIDPIDYCSLVVREGPSAGVSVVTAAELSVSPTLVAMTADMKLVGFECSVRRH